MVIEAGSVVVSVIPSARGFGRKLDAQIRAELKGVTDKVKIHVNGDTTDAKTKIDEIKAEMASIKDGKAGVEINSTAAKARLKELETELTRFDHKEYKAKVGVDQKGINFAFRGVGALATAIVGLGPAAVAAGGVAAAGIGVLGASLASAGGAAAIYGTVMSSAVKNYKKDVLKIQTLSKGLGSDPVKNKLLTDQIDAIQAAWSKQEKQFDLLQGKFTDGFKALVKASGPATFGVLNKGIKVLMGIFPKLPPIINAVGTAVGGLIDEFGKFSKGKEFQSLLDFFRIDGVRAIKSFAHIAGNLLLGVFDIFKALGPYQGKLLDGIEALTVKFRVWAGSVGKSNGLTKFMDYARKYLPDVEALFVNLIKFTGRFSASLVPLGGAEIKILSIFLQALNHVPPKVLTMLAFGIQTIVLGLKAWQAGFVVWKISQALFVKGDKEMAAAQRVLNFVMKHNTIGLVVLALTALVGGLIYAYKHSQTFHHIVVETWTKVKEAVSVAWNKGIKPVLTAFVGFLKNTVGPWIKKLWRDYVQPMFQKIGDFIAASWKHVVKPVLAAFVWYLKHVYAPVIVWLWKHVYKPAFDGIGAIIKFSWNHVVKPLFQATKKFITDVLAPVIRWLWHKVFTPVFNGIGAVVKFSWNHVVKPIFTAIKKFIENVLAPVVRWLWHKVVTPVFNGIGTVVKNAWTKVVRPIFTAIKKFITDTLAPIIRWLWHRVVKPAFDGIGTAVTNAWTKVIRPAFGSLRDGLGKVKDAFHSVVTWVKDKWGDLSDMAKKPVRFIVNTIIRDGILAGIRKIPGLGGVGKGFKGVSFATGGVLPGYTPGQDVHHFHSPTAGPLHLSGGEGILIPQATRALGGESGIKAINDRFRNRTQKFAKGGLFWPTVGRKISTYKGHDGVDINQPPGPDFGAPIYAYRSGKITYAGWNRGYGHAIFEKAPGYPEVVYGHGSAVYVHKGQSVKGGQMIGRVGATGHASGPHLHFGRPGGTYAQALALLHGAGAAPGGQTAMGGGTAKKYPNFKNPLTALFHKVSDWKNRLSDMGGGFGDVVGKVPGKLLSMISNPLAFVGKAIKKALSAVVRIGKGIFSTGSYGPHAAGVYKALRAQGWTPQASAGIMGNMQYESGFSPTIIQGGSHGTPAQAGSRGYGLVQWTPASKIARMLHGRAPNVGNEVAALTGELHGGYGSLVHRMQASKSPFNAAMMFLHEFERPKNPNQPIRGVAATTWFNKFGAQELHDQGGLAYGKGFMAKNIIKPERVLSPRQTENHERLTDVLDRMSQGGKGGRTELVITNWKTGQGYIRHLASDEVASASEFAGTRRRMS